MQQDNFKTILLQEIMLKWKKYGRKPELRSDWEARKIEIERMIYTPDPIILFKLRYVSPLRDVTVIWQNAIKETIEEISEIIQGMKVCEMQFEREITQVELVEDDIKRDEGDLEQRYNSSDKGVIQDHEMSVNYQVNYNQGEETNFVIDMGNCVTPLCGVATSPIAVGFCAAVFGSHKINRSIVSVRIMNLSETVAEVVESEYQINDINSDCEVKYVRRGDTLAIKYVMDFVDGEDQARFMNDYQDNVMRHIRIKKNRAIGGQGMPISVGINFYFEVEWSNRLFKKLRTKNILKSVMFAMGERYRTPIGRWKYREQLKDVYQMQERKTYTDLYVLELENEKRNFECEVPSFKVWDEDLRVIQEEKKRDKDFKNLARFIKSK